MIGMRGWGPDGHWAEAANAFMATGKKVRAAVKNSPAKKE